jgi:hypothetical protein
LLLLLSFTTSCKVPTLILIGRKRIYHFLRGILSEQWCYAVQLLRLCALEMSNAVRGGARFFCSGCAQKCLMKYKYYDIWLRSSIR